MTPATLTHCRVWLVCLCVSGIAATWVATEQTRAQNQAAPVLKGYEEIAKPFIKQHCLSCHGAEKAKAGYRIDLIGTDFSAATVADHWKEVIDRINAGEMPPKESPRPDAQQVAAFVTWVNGNCIKLNWRRRTRAGGFQCGGSIATSTPTRCAIS